MEAAQTIAWGVLGLFLLLGCIVFIHELGHFIACRMLGIQVLEFAVGMGPTACQWQSKKTATIFKICWLPIGGYVKPLSTSEEVFKNLKPDEQKAVASQCIDKAGSARQWIMYFMGPAFNFLLTFFIFFILAFNPRPEILPLIQPIEDKPLAMAGFEVGDQLMSVAGEPTPTMTRAVQSLIPHIGSEFNVVVLRAESEVMLTVDLRDAVLERETNILDLLGLRASSIEVAPTPPITIAEAVGHGVSETAFFTQLTLSTIGNLFTGSVATDNLGSAITIGDNAGEALQVGWISFAILTAVLSINIGILNLLPIRPLDGGHLLFLSVEILIRRPLPEAIHRYSLYVGFALIACFMLLSVSNDIYYYLIA
ncbi:M50 family metallopeptidase [Neptuniibacter sp. QD37_11]|uniref:M50 family metallopeptidase n=1 Tax=Neptuniibacter sp. QD37_11 TaxID=3398209 RepID=UPI0039F45972